MRTKKKKVLISLAIISMVLSVLIFLFWGVVSMMSIITKEQVEYYKDDAVYEEITVHLAKEKDGSIYFESDDERYDFISLWEKNATVVEENNFYNEIIDGELITVKTAPRIFWDAYSSPIVELRTESKVYLDFETGKANLIKYVQDGYFRHVSFTAWTLSISALFLGGSIFLFIYLRIKSKSELKINL